MDIPTVVVSIFSADFMDIRQPADSSICRALADVHFLSLARNGEGEWNVRKHGWSNRRAWRKVHLAMDPNTGQICAALMTHQDVGDGEVLSDLLDQIPAGVSIDIIGGDGAYDTKPCHAQIAERGATPSIPSREGAMPWPDSTPGAEWRNTAISEISQSSRREWKQASGFHQCSLAENLMYRLKTTTGAGL